MNEGPAGNFLLLQPVLHAGGAIYKGQLLFVTTRRGTTGNMVQRHLFQILLHAYSTQCRRRQNVAMRRSSAVGVRPLQATRFYFYRHFSPFGWLVGALSV